VTAYIALLRGINVGGNKLVSMAALREMLTGLGCASVTTILQSGNAVFRAAARAPAQLELELEAAIERTFGFPVEVHVRTAAEWRAIVDANPFPVEAAKDPGHLLVTCFKTPLTKASVDALRAAIAGPERLEADRRQLYMVYPDGVGTSKAAVLAGRMLPRGTARNWNTVLKLAAAAEK
jgi:uncharacterized protein (DUF1697 family)